jgi:hypothetical protein
MCKAARLLRSRRRQEGNGQRAKKLTVHRLLLLHAKRTSDILRKAHQALLESFPEDRQGGEEQSVKRRTLDLSRAGESHQLIF